MGEEYKQRDIPIEDFKELLDKVDPGDNFYGPLKETLAERIDREKSKETSDDNKEKND